LSIRIRNFNANITLASFVQWAGLFFDGPLAIKHFHNTSIWKLKEMKPDHDECDNTNWRLVYDYDETGREEEGYDVEILLRRLQAMAIREPLVEHKDSWNLVDHVYKWLIDFTTESRSLRGLSSDSKELHKAKARLAKVTKDRIARIGTKGLLS
jgi:hypothetical protein